MNARHPGPQRRAYAGVVLAAVAALLAGLGIWATAGDGTADEGLPDNAVSGEPLTGPCAPDAALVPRCGAWWGAYIPDDGNGSLTAPVYGVREEDRAQARPRVHVPRHVGEHARWSVAHPRRAASARDRLLMLAWESTVWKEPHHANWTETQLGWRNIPSGRRQPRSSTRRSVASRRTGSGSSSPSTRRSTPASRKAREPPRSTSPPTAICATASRSSAPATSCGCGRSPAIWGSAQEMKRLYPGTTTSTGSPWTSTTTSPVPQHHGLEGLRPQPATQPRLAIANISDEKPLMMAEFATVPIRPTPTAARLVHRCSTRVVPHHARR